MKLESRVAVITGAGSGIGKAVALTLARHGCNLALADINEYAVAQVAHEATRLGVSATHHRLDVADRAAVSSFPAAVLATYGEVHLLINNAGIAAGGTFEQVTEATFDLLMEVNFHGLVRMTRAFLPALRQVDRACIVNMSSLYGLVSPAGQAAYSASKFAVRGFSNALRHELAGSNVNMCVVHPGGVATSIAQNARAAIGIDQKEDSLRRKDAARLLRMPPERAAEIIVRGIQRDKARILVGADAKLVAILERLVPVSYWRVLQTLIANR